LLPQAVWEYVDYNNLYKWNENVLGCQFSVLGVY
jgi:hypothetical protein